MIATLMWHEVWDNKASVTLLEYNPVKSHFDKGLLKVKN